MPFLNQITEYINDVLKEGSLKSAKLQPAKYDGIATNISRKKDKAAKLEVIPAIVEGGIIKSLIAPDHKLALHLYHKVISNVYSYNKKSYGDSYDIKCITDMNLVVIFNTKLTGRAQEVLEPVVIFGLPQRLSTALTADLQIGRCVITPLSSNMDAMIVFKTEFPHHELFLNESMSMFSIKYKIEMTFSQACVDACLCN